jgi:hypothetical protein
MLAHGMPSSFFDVVDKTVVVVVVGVVVIVEELAVVTSSISFAAESRQSQDQM